MTSHEALSRSVARNRDFRSFLLLLPPLTVVVASVLLPYVQMDGGLFAVAFVFGWAQLIGL